MFCDDVVFFFHWDYLACAHLRAFTPVSANMCRMGVRNVFSASVATEQGELQEQKLKSNHLAQFVKLLTAINSTPWILKFRWLPLQIIVRFLRIQKSKQNDAKLNYKSLPMEGSPENDSRHEKNRNLFIQKHDDVIHHQVQNWAGRNPKWSLSKAS